MSPYTRGVSTANHTGGNVTFTDMASMYYSVSTAPSTTVMWMEEGATISDFESEAIKMNNPKFKKGDRVKYVDYNGHIEFTGKIVHIANRDYHILRDDGHEGGGIRVNGVSTYLISTTDERLQLFKRNIREEIERRLKNE